MHECFTLILIYEMFNKNTHSSFSDRLLPNPVISLWSLRNLSGDIIKHCLAPWRQDLTTEILNKLAI